MAFYTCPVHSVPPVAGAPQPGGGPGDAYRGYPGPGGYQQPPRGPYGQPQVPLPPQQQPLPSSQQQQQQQPPAQQTQQSQSGAPGGGVGVGGPQGPPGSVAGVPPTTNVPGASPVGVAVGPAGGVVGSGGPAGPNAVGGGPPGAYGGQQQQQQGPGSGPFDYRPDQVRSSFVLDNRQYVSNTYTCPTVSAAPQTSRLHERASTVSAISVRPATTGLR